MLLLKVLTKKDNNFSRDVFGDRVTKTIMRKSVDVTFLFLFFYIFLFEYVYIQSQTVLLRGPVSDRSVADCSSTGLCVSTKHVKQSIKLVIKITREPPLQTSGKY